MKLLSGHSKQKQQANKNENTEDKFNNKNCIFIFIHKIIK